ncbi:MAG: HAD-IC family P-type ATPase [Rhizobacter sp.]|nr:HAD-IC family P-type ATPase [Chlorobiales bacterium]
MKQNSDQPASGEGLPDAPHSQAVDAVAQSLEVEPARGLSKDEAETRRKKFGENTLPVAEPTPWWMLLLNQFKSLVVLLLVAAVLIAAFTGETVEAIAIGAVLLINALVGFFTEWQAQQALDALKKQATTKARVRREGNESQIDAAELVPGDIVLLAAGDKIPADARLIEAKSLRTEESALTGESSTVDKKTDPVAKDAPLAERPSMLYLGTTVSAGRAVAVVTATGVQTELGHIGKLVADSKTEPTPLEKRLGDLGQRLVYLVLIIAAAVFITGLLRGGKVLELIEVTLSLAVAAVPEGLPAVTTLVLALGVLRMAKRNALVRRLPAVETLGSATVICTDKTGTLTQNRMTVQEFHLAGDDDNGGTVETHGDHKHNLADQNLDQNLLGRAARVAVLCNEASFDKNAKDDARSLGDPTETSLVIAAADRLGLDVAKLRDAYPRKDERPFDSETKRMITVHEQNGERLALLKGAPGTVLDACTNYATGDANNSPALDDASRERFKKMDEAMAEKAMRVLGLAEKHLKDDDLEKGYTFLGFVGMIDPPRPEAKEAIKRAHEAGIRVVMLTGDQVSTARAIARDLELGEAGKELKAMHARELKDVSPEKLKEFALSVDVFARISPEDKLKVVEALQQSGEIVAVTGDGVNDAPALKKADIGIAMGQRGTEVAKEAAGVVLSDDNFATIIGAIEGGRAIYANIVKFVHLLFTCNLSEVLVIFVAIAIGLPLPLLPLQILWVNLVTDVFPALALAVEPPAPDVMQQKPRSPKESLLSRPFIVLILWQGVLLAAVVLAAYLWALNEYGDGVHAHSVTLLSLVSVQLAQLFNCRSQVRSAFADIGTNVWLWAAAGGMIGLQLLAMYLPPLAGVLGLESPAAIDWLVAGVSLVIPLAVVEIVKAVSRTRNSDVAADRLKSDETA